MILSNRLNFYDYPITYKYFFDNNLHLYRHHMDKLFILIDINKRESPKLKIIEPQFKHESYKIVSDVDGRDMSGVRAAIKRINIYMGEDLVEYGDILDRKNGGSKASVKKVVCGKLRCIYKIHGSRKEHLKYKGRLITVAEYKKMMKVK